MIEVLCFGDPQQRACRRAAAWADLTFGGQAQVMHYDVWSRPDLARRHRVLIVPTVIVVHDGEEITRFNGRPGVRSQRRALAHVRTALAA